MTADTVLDRGAKVKIQNTETVVVVGAATRGTHALREFLRFLPRDAPGIPIALHMPNASAA